MGTAARPRLDRELGHRGDREHPSSELPEARDAAAGRHSPLATRSAAAASARSDALQVRDGQSARAER